jgi:hypothetical protein
VAQEIRLVRWGVYPSLNETTPLTFILGPFQGPLPDGVDSINQMMYCSDLKDANTCYPSEFGKRYLAGR